MSQINILVQKYKAKATQLQLLTSYEIKYSESKQTKSVHITREFQNENLYHSSDKL